MAETWQKWDGGRGYVVRKRAHRLAYPTTNKRSRLLGYPFCIECGLVALRNDVTQRALRASCDVWEDK